MFEEENDLEKIKTETSPSGRYTLDLYKKDNGKGYWAYTTGVVSVDGKEIATVNRNYSSFPFLFIEDYNGHDYLVCGEDYQGQTVIELDTGRRRDFRPEAAKKGHGFCWAQYQFHREAKMLVVDGCIWACPYEYRFYDFSDPMENGWPELEIGNEKGYLYSDDGQAPKIHEDGSITCYESRELDEDDYPSVEAWEEAEEEYEVVASQTFRRNGMKLELIDSWVDKREADRREKNRLAREKWEKEWKEYKATDPLFLMVKEAASKPPFKRPEYAVSIGRCFDGWCPHWSGTDARICFRLLWQYEVPTWKVELQWGRNEAPINLSVSKGGKSLGDFWFERSEEQMQAALDKAASFLNA
jgi:hypothetical protein